MPAHLQGSAFLGSKAGAPRELFFGGKDRQGECADTVRTVRDRRFQYLRNFQPHLPYGQYMSYIWQHESTRAWARLHQEGRLTGPSARFFAPRKPVEELYDVERDPWQINNLAADPAYAGELARLRSELFKQMENVGDLGLLPEPEMHARAAKSTPYEIATDPKANPLRELLRVASLAGEADSKNVPVLAEQLRASDSAVRWWAATGLLALREQAAPARATLEAALSDSSPDVRIAAAEALAHLGGLEQSLPVIAAALSHDDVLVRLVALSAASRLGTRAQPWLPAIRQAGLRSREHKDVATYVARMVEYLPAQIAP
jgi:hypothetical protein